LDDYGKSIYEKAVLYQMFHTFALFLVGVLNHLFKKLPFLSPVGILYRNPPLFGSLYVLAITHLKWLGVITPVEDGISFWLVLARMDAP